MSEHENLPAKTEQQIPEDVLIILPVRNTVVFPGAVIPLTQTPKRASDLVIAAAPPADPSFTVDQMLTAPKGRVDDFGLGQTVVTTEETPPVAAATPVAAQ